MNVSSYSHSLAVFTQAAEKGRLKASLAGQEAGHKQIMDSVALSKEALIQANAQNATVDMNIINLGRETPYKTEYEYTQAVLAAMKERTASPEPENIELIKRFEEKLNYIIHSSANEEEASGRGKEFYEAMILYIYDNADKKLSYDEVVTHAEQSVAELHKSQVKDTIFTDMAKLHGSREWKIQYLMKVYTEKMLMGDMGAADKLRQLEQYSQALEDVRDVFTEVGEMFEE